MAAVGEISQGTRLREYKISFKAATWATMLVLVVMAGLYAILGLPPSLGGFYSDMYFHSIGIAIAALASYLVIVAFDLRKHEPDLDFPLHYRALIAVLFGAVAGVFFLNPDVNAALRPIPMGLLIIGFLFLADVGGALLVELWILPRKLAGTYNPKANYLFRMFPANRKDLHAYRKMNAAYWLAFLAVGSAFVAGLIGIVNLWVLTFGPSIFAGYISFLGLDQARFLDATLDPHSHEMALAIMAGVIAVAAQQFRVLDLSGLKRGVARLGLWVSSLGVIAMTVVMVAIAFANFAPPTLLAGGPGGVNGIAGDDAAMTVIAVGALILLVPMALTPLGAERKRSWRDAVRLSLLGSWIFAVLVSVIAGFYIEFHEDLFQSGLAANDAIYGQLQPMFGVFVLTGVALVLLVVDAYGIERTPRRVIGWMAAVGMVVATAGAFSWAFIDPTVDSASFWAHVLGVVIIGVSVFVGVLAVRAVVERAPSGLETVKASPSEPSFLMQCTWTPDKTGAVMTMMSMLMGMARSGSLPEGFELLWIRRDPQATQAFCAWRAPAKQSLESLVGGLHPPGIHVVHELRPMA